MKTRYICDKCGFNIEVNPINGYNIIPPNCPICKGKLISEEEMKRNIEEDNDKDDDITPKQDAYEIDDILKHDLVEQMKENIKREGNDRIWLLIERNLGEAKQRARMRTFFLLAEGKCPVGETIKI